MKEATITNIETLPINSLTKDPNHPRKESGNLES